MPDIALPLPRQAVTVATEEGGGLGGGQWVGRGQLRREDAALLRGEGRFVGDIRIPGCLHVVFVRGQQRGRILVIDTAAARAVPGVTGVFTAEDLSLCGQTAVNPLVDTLEPAPLKVLAREQVEAVGQPVVAVVAETLHAAIDAAELVIVETSADTAPLAGSFSQTWPHAAPEPRPDDVVVRVNVQHARLSPSAIEPRAALAAWDAATDDLTVWLATQTPHRARADLAVVLGFPETAIRVIAPDVGGAFGGKASIYPEDIFVAWAARHLETAVRWAGSRAEDLLAGTQGRGLHCEGVLTLGADGVMRGLHARVQAPLGHWMPFSAVVPGRNAGRILPGPYHLDQVDVAVTGTATPDAAMGIYRGAGRPEAAMLMERLVEAAARRLEMDPVALRKLNLVSPHAVPLHRPTGEVLDSGDLPALLERAVVESGYHARRREQAARRSVGEIVGIGMAVYVEPCGAGWESARLRLSPDGSFEAATGATAQGQGRETAYAQILADELHILPERISVQHGDTALTPLGIGALASRSTAIGGSALKLAGAALVALARPIAARMLGTNNSQALILDACGFSQPGSQMVVNWAEIAATLEVPLQVEQRFETPGEAWSGGCCIAAIAIDPETFTPQVEHITLVDDAGTVINPMLVHGQLIGGIAQGVGEAMLERIVYDADGQLLTGSLMDYALPRASDIPPVHLASQPSPTPLNPLGAKGVGEAGCIGVPAAIVNAAIDALAPYGVQDLTMPLTAESIWRALRDQPKTGVPTP